MSEYGRCHRIIEGKVMRRENKTFAGLSRAENAPEANNAKQMRIQ